MELPGTVVMYASMMVRVIEVESPQALIIAPERALKSTAAHGTQADPQAKFPVQG